MHPTLTHGTMAAINGCATCNMQRAVRNMLCTAPIFFVGLGFLLHRDLVLRERQCLQEVAIAELLPFYYLSCKKTRRTFDGRLVIGTLGREEPSKTTTARCRVGVTF